MLPTVAIYSLAGFNGVGAHAGGQPRAFTVDYENREEMLRDLTVALQQLDPTVYIRPADVMTDGEWCMSDADYIAGAQECFCPGDLEEERGHYTQSITGGMAGCSSSHLYAWSSFAKQHASPHQTSDCVSHLAVLLSFSAFPRCFVFFFIFFFFFVGFFAIFFSHILLTALLWQQLLVFENDVRAESAFVGQLNHAVMNLRAHAENWDMCVFTRGGSAATNSSPGTEVDITDGMGAFALRQAQHVAGTLCYLISARGAARLATSGFHEELFCVDDFLNAVNCWHVRRHMNERVQTCSSVLSVRKLGFTMYVSEPRRRGQGPGIVSTESSHKSDIVVGSVRHDDQWVVLTAL